MSKVNGVPKEGKTVIVRGDFNVTIPYGAFYVLNDHADAELLKITHPSTLPEGYRDGVFFFDDEIETDWYVRVQADNSWTFEFESQSKAKSELARAISSGPKMLVDLCDEMKTRIDALYGVNVKTRQKNMIRSEDRYIGYCVFEDPHLDIVIVAIINVIDVKNASIRTYTVNAQVPGGLESEVLSLVESIAGSGTEYRPPESLRQVLAGEFFKTLDFSKGERVNVGEFSIVIPDGLKYSRQANTDTRIISVAPDYVSFKYEDWDDIASLVLTLQHGIKTDRIEEAFDSPNAEKKIKDLFHSVNLTAAKGKVNTNARKTLFVNKDLYVAYVFAFEDDETGGALAYFYFVLTRDFLYNGQLFVKKWGLSGDYRADAARFLEKWLKTIQFTEGDSSALADYAEHIFGRFASPDGKIDAIAVAQLFAEDVLSFDVGKKQITWDGKHHDIAGITFNAEKQDEYPEIIDNANVFINAVGDVLRFAEENEKLTVPIDKIHKQLHKTLLRQNLTGITLFHLMAWHAAKIQKIPDADEYIVALDINLPSTVPGAFDLLAEFVKTLRAYNGIHTAFDLTFATYRYLDGADMLQRKFDASILEDPVAGAQLGISALHVDG
jgi:hypothetical protein